MEKRTKTCPACQAEMEFRLGQYECPACGHFEAAEPPAQHPGQEQRDDGIHRAKLQIPKQAPKLPSYSRIGIKEPPEPRAYPSLSSEKVTYLTVFFALQLGSSFVLAFQYTGPLGAAFNLPGMLVSAVFGTICVGFVLYYDSECVRQCCLWNMILAAIVTLTAVIMAFSTQQTILALPLIPDLLMTGWLAAILMRDTRSG